MRYWLNISSMQSWQTEESAGKFMLGASKKWKGLVSRISPGDLIAEYLAGETQSFAAVFVATSPMYEDTSRFWPQGTYPYRVDREPALIKQEGSIGVLARLLVRRLGFVRNKAHWGTYFQVKLRELSREDLLAIWNALAQRGAVQKIALSTLEKTVASSAATPGILGAVGAEHVVTAPEFNTGGELYSYYRELGLDHMEATLMERVQTLLSKKAPGLEDVIDNHLALSFALNELSQGTPRGWLREELSQLDARRNSLIFVWAQACTLAALVDMKRIAKALRKSPDYPTGKLASKGRGT